MKRQYKNISQRADRYANAKMRHTRAYAYPVTIKTVAALGFADGYRFAMKEIRRLTDGQTYITRELFNFVNNTERLK